MGDRALSVFWGETPFSIGGFFMDDPTGFTLKEILGLVYSIQNKVGQNEGRLNQVEDWLKGSMNTRETRAETRAEIRAEIRGALTRIEKLEDRDIRGEVREATRGAIDRIISLEDKDKKLDDRFFQIWCGVGFSIFAIAVQAVIWVLGQKGTP